MLPRLDLREKWLPQPVQLIRIPYSLIFCHLFICCIFIMVFLVYSQYFNQPFNFHQLNFGVSAFPLAVVSHGQDQRPSASESWEGPGVWVSRDSPSLQQEVQVTKALRSGSKARQSLIQSKVEAPKESGSQAGPQSVVRPRTKESQGVKILGRVQEVWSGPEQRSLHRQSGYKVMSK